MADGVKLVGWCPLCEQPRYVSKVLIKSPDDCKAENFQGINCPDPQSGSVPLCGECNSVVKFMTEEQLGNIAARKMGQAPPTRPPRTSHVPASTGTGIEEIFSLGPDEELRGMKELGPSVIVIVTNKRIVKVNLEIAGVG